jgi:hypothetical protein
MLAQKGANNLRSVRVWRQLLVSEAAATVGHLRQFANRKIAYITAYIVPP